MPVKSIVGIILVTENVEKLAGFYAHGLDLRLEREEHGDLDVHYGVDLGTLHFAIHPPGNFGGTSSRGAAIAFHVHLIDAYVPRLVELGAKLLTPTRNEGFGKVATLADPEGNLLELVELDYDFDDEATLR